ncbi:MAG TPA: hypothetical protein VGK84_04555 [Candidatus Tumulicola sp.]|jgi:hypothetical protein
MQSPIFRFALTAAFFITLTSSTLSFKEALSACGPGTLGSVSFILGHVRAASKPGVTQEEDTTNNGISTVRFTQTSNNKQALVIADGRYRSVTANNAHPALKNQVACILPD